MIPRRIELHEVAHELRREAVGEARLARADAVLAAGEPCAPIHFVLFPAIGEGDVEWLAAHHRALHDGIHRRNLRRRQATILLAALALDGLHVEHAGARIGHDPVGEAIERIALLHHRLGENAARGRIEHRRLDLLRIGIHLLRDGGERRRDAHEVDSGCACDDAIKIVGIALRHHQRLPSAIGAACEVGAIALPPIACIHQRLGRLARAVDRGVRVVCNPLEVTGGPCAINAARRRGVPRIRAGDRIAFLQRLQAQRLALDAAGEAALSAHHELAVPRFRQPDGEVDLLPDDAIDLAVRCRRCAGRGLGDLHIRRAKAGERLAGDLRLRRPGHRHGER